MCQKDVIIPKDVDDEIKDKCLDKKKYEKMQKLCKQSALKNIKKRKILPEIIDIDDDKPYDLVFAEYPDYRYAFRQSLRF